MSRYGLSPPQPEPWLLYRHGRGYTIKTFCTIGPPESEKKNHQYSRRCKFPELPGGKDIIASFKGWLLLQNGCKDDAGMSNYHQHYYYVLWNPATLESIDFAPLELGKNHKIDYHLLYEDGDMLNLFLFESTMPCIFRCRCLRRGGGGGGGNWLAIQYREEIEAYYKKYEGDEKGYPLHLELPLVCNGKFYALTHGQRRLAEIQFIDYVDDDDAGLSSNNKNEIKGGAVLIRWLGCRIPYGAVRFVFPVKFLVESKGEIFLIVIETGVVFEMGRIDAKVPVAVNVFRLNFSDMVWSKIDSFEDRVFFLCYGSYGNTDIGSNWSNCFSQDVVQGDRNGNNIYFIKNNEKYLYRYNMEDNSILVTFPCPALNNTSWLSPVWVMPNIVNREGDKLFPQREENLKSVDVENLKIVDVEEQGRTSTTHVFDLGLDLLTFIAKKLLCFDYMFFRESCNMFRSAAPLIRWRTVLSGSELATCHSSSRTCLVIPGKNVLCVVDPHVVGRKYFITSPILSLEDVTIKCSKDGWLLLCCSKEPKTIIFYNPFTKDVIQLPDLDAPEVQTGFAFSSLPSSDDCVTISIEHNLACAEIHLFFSGEANWETVQFNNTRNFMPSFNNPVFWDGAIYFLGQTGNLGVLTIKRGGRHCWQVLNKPSSPCKSFHQHFLVECGGELLSVFVGYMGRRVEVFRLSSTKMTWKKVYSLGNYVLFISRSSSFSTLAKTQGMEDRIYFPRLYEGNPVYYSLKTRKLQVVGSNDSLPDFCGTAEQLLSGWVEPRWW